jgi:hypothetical protein
MVADGHETTSFFAAAQNDPNCTIRSNRVKSGITTNDFRLPTPDPRLRILDLRLPTPEATP